MNKKIQIQFVLYNNNVAEINKMILSIRNGINIAKENGLCFHNITLKCGDASQKPILGNDEIKKIQKLLNEDIAFQYVFFNCNTGYGRGHNILSQKSEADYLIIMNPDIILSPRFFIEILQPFDNESVGVVEARQVPVEHPKEYDIVTKETEWSSGACFAVRNYIFRKIGGFDDKTFFMYCEDVDLSWRIRIEGFKLIYQPLAPVFHSKMLSNNGLTSPSDTEIYYSSLSALLMAYKWSGENELERLRNVFSESQSELLKRALTDYETLKKNNDLPSRLDAQHKVAKFLDGYYTLHRYIL